MKVVIDTNILFSALLKEKTYIADILIQNEQLDHFLTPRYAIVELFKHKERIAQLSALKEEELLEMLHLLLKQIQFIDESMITTSSYIEARRLTKGVDDKDLLFVAMAIEFDAYLWTNDQQLIRGLQLKGFNSFYIASGFK